jgi:hypothetical protein
MNFRSPDPVVAKEASTMLAFSLHVLERSAAHNPGVKRVSEVLTYATCFPLTEPPGAEP